MMFYCGVTVVVLFYDNHLLESMYYIQLAVQGNGFCSHCEG